MEIPNINPKESPMEYIANIYNSILDNMEKNMPDDEENEKAIHYGHILDHIINATKEYLGDGKPEDVLGALADGVEMEDEQSLVLVHYRAKYIKDWFI